MVEGNGCVNDFSRTLAAVVWESKIPNDAVTIFSGGTEGVLCPHVTFIVRSHEATGLSATVGHTKALAPDQVGTVEHAGEVSQTVTSLVKELGVSQEQVQLVLIKCPLLTSEKLETIRGQGKHPITTDTYESMAKSRYASAVGIAAALDEIAEAQVEEALRTEHPWSAKASCSSGAELDDCHIFVLASDIKSAAQGQLGAISKPMKDAIDASVIIELLEQIKKEGGQVVQVFAKAEADPRGQIRGWRHTMNTDSDLHSTRHARAAVGGLIAGLVGDTQVYVSGGAEGQGPSGGGSLCIVYRVP
ncbi:ring-opening amidohydrolase [Exophiala viscosa]|uniref:ring-opening amidohydrolase n=1 Tax=Exophiala viscosa TaxID=2486360 RepID=UPI0021919A1B|nr:ring-opening amidohydrolase [Exophiala viscosa]